MMKTHNKAMEKHGVSRVDIASMLQEAVSTLLTISRNAVLGPLVTLIIVSAFNFDAVRQYLLEADAADVQFVCLELMVISTIIGMAMDSLRSFSWQARHASIGRRGGYDRGKKTQATHLDAGDSLLRELGRRNAIATFEQACDIKDLIADLSSEASGAGSDLLDYRALKAMNCTKTSLRPTQSVQDAEALMAYRRDGNKSEIEGVRVTTAELENGQYRATLLLDGGHVVAVKCAYSIAVAITSAVLAREIMVHRF